MHLLTKDSKKRAPRLYWSSSLVVFLAFMASGVANLLHAEHVAADMLHLGYPAYFSTIIGVWKIAGAFVLVAPRLPILKEWAYAGMVFDLSGAALSRASIGDEVGTIIVPLVLLGLVALSWATRPQGRLPLLTDSPSRWAPTLGSQ